MVKSEAEAWDDYRSAIYEAWLKREQEKKTKEQK